MGLFKYPGSKVWSMEFVFHGQRIRESTGTRNKTLAQKVEDKRRRDLEEGHSGVKKRQKPKLFAAEAKGWLEIKSVTLAPSSVSIAKANLKHLLPIFGKSVVSDIEAVDVARYQRKRIEEGAANKSINLELGTLRAILKRSGHWAQIQPDVKMLKVVEDTGRAISLVEQRALLQACSMSRSRLILPFVTLALETGARFGVIRTLQWGNVDFVNRCLKWGKDKTSAGTGRVVPLNQRAITCLEFWATSFPKRKAHHYVFPAESYGGGVGKAQAVAFDVDPEKPIGSIKEAWEFSKKRAGLIMADLPLDSKERIPALQCRFHDLRHTAITRMRNNGTPIEKIAKIVGWSTGQMVRMAALYGHYSLNDLREAVENIGGGEVSGSPVISPVSDEESIEVKPN